MLPLLDTSKTLTKLDFGREYSNAASGNELIKTMEKNYNVTDLEINYAFKDSRINQPVHHRLEIVLALNRRGRRFLMEDRGSKVKAVKLLSEVAQGPIYFQCKGFGRFPPVDISLDCLFFCIRENPGIFYIV